MSLEATGGGFMRAPPGAVSDEGSLESLGARIGTWIPALVFFYTMIVWPLAFGSPHATIAEESLGWMVVVNQQDDSVWKRIAYPALCGLAVLVGAVTGAYRRVPWTDKGVVLVLFVVALALASTIWSEFRGITLMRAVLLGMVVLTMALPVFAATSSQAIVTRMFWVVFAAALLNAVALAVRAPSSIGHAGVYDHKNVFGWVAALVLYFGLYRLVAGRLAERVAGAIMVVLAPLFLVAAESKTSLGLAVICPALGTVLWIAAKRYRLSPAILVLLSVVVAVFVFKIGRAAGVWDIYAINNAVFGNPTLTGRTEIWHFVVGLIGDKPLLGYGYEAVFATGPNGIVQRNAVGFVRAMPTAHNGYLDIWVQIGLLGLVATLSLLAAIFHVVGRMAEVRPGLGWLGLTAVLFVALHNGLESDFMISSNPLSMLALLFFFIALKARRESVSRP